MCFTENWEPKGKFPPGIRPVLGAVALKAVRLNEYNDNFFNLMPRIFPYNRFTMSVRFGYFSSESFSAYVHGMQKLIKRQIFPDHMALLVKRQDELLVELKAVADEGFPRAKEEWERSVAAWGTYLICLLWDWSVPDHSHQRRSRKRAKWKVQLRQLKIHLVLKLHRYLRRTMA